MTVTSPSFRQVILKKVTLRYIASEDRVRMDAQPEVGDAIVFWLTQRLCRELVCSLVEYLTSAGAVGVGTAAEHLTAVQEFKQQHAKQVKKSASPVVHADVGKGTPRSYLVSKLQLRSNPKALQVVFPLQESGEAVLTFKPNEVRQWMSILYQQYQVAGWPLGIWPQWMAETAPPKAKKAGRALH